MNLTSRTIFIISGDLVLAQRCFEELAGFGGRYRTLIVGTVEQARKRIGRSAPAAVFLDESAIDIVHGGETVESAVAMLTETAPVVVAAAPEKQAGMAFLITSGAVDFVARTSERRRISRRFRSGDCNPSKSRLFSSSRRADRRAIWA